MLVVPRLTMQHSIRIRIQDKIVMRDIQAIGRETVLDRLVLFVGDKATQLLQHIIVLIVTTIAATATTSIILPINCTFYY